jgi:hypothetical protein
MSARDYVLVPRELNAAIARAWGDIIQAAEHGPEALQAAQPCGGEGRSGWRDEEMARHWIDRYAAGIDGEPQMDRILECVGTDAGQAGGES